MQANKQSLVLFALLLGVFGLIAVAVHYSNHKAPRHELARLDVRQAEAGATITLETSARVRFGIQAEYEAKPLFDSRSRILDDSRFSITLSPTTTGSPTTVLACGAGERPRAASNAFLTFDLDCTFDAPQGGAFAVKVKPNWAPGLLLRRADLVVSIDTGEGR